MNLYSERLEALIKAALADGELTDKERQVLMRKAAEEGIDPDEFEMVLNARVTELEATKQKTKKSKNGSSRKCPACGAIVSPHLPVCPDCGYEFAGVEAVASMKKFLDEVKRARRDDSDILESDVVDNYPIPNAKSDLLEFMLVLKPRLKWDDCYIDKYSECVERAKLMFPGDPLFKKYIDGFDPRSLKELKEKKEKEEKRFLFKCGLGAVLMIVAVTAFIIFLKVLEKKLGISLGI